MARSASAALMPLADAVGLLTGGLRAVTPRRVPTAAACGLLAARDIVAGADLPARLTARRDGWAVALEAVAGASSYAPVLLGEAPAWIESGEALPAGCDTVLPPEAIDAGSPAEVLADAPPGEGAAPGGTDIRAGETLVTGGERVSPVQLLALALAGIEAVEVRVPRVALVATGEGSGGGDALTPILKTLIAGWGGEVTAARRVSDGPEAIAQAIAETEADAVFVTGGTGFGRTDHAAAALARVGTVRAHGIALRPGDTAGFGTARDRPVLLLPGRPEACLAALLALGQPLLRVLSGTVEKPRPVAPLLRKVTSPIGLSEIVFVRRTPSGLDPLGGAEIALRHLQSADGAITIPPDSEGYPEGFPVEMALL